MPYEEKKPPLSRREKLSRKVRERAQPAPPPSVEERIRAEVNRQVAEQLASGQLQPETVTVPSPSATDPPPSDVPPPSPPVEESAEEKERKLEEARKAVSNLKLEVKEWQYTDVRGFLVHVAHEFPPEDHEMYVSDARQQPHESGGAEVQCVLMVRNKDTGKRVLVNAKMESASNKETEPFIEFVDTAHKAMKRGGKEMFERIFATEE